MAYKLLKRSMGEDFDNCSTKVYIFNCLSFAFAVAAGRTGLGQYLDIACLPRLLCGTGYFFGIQGYGYSGVSLLFAFLNVA